MKKVAITGGLACGKSSVCHLLKKFGAYVASADDIVHHLLSPHTSLGKRVIELLGSTVVFDGEFDRRKIAQKVFKDPFLLFSLENLLHPAVFQEITRQYQEVERRGDHPLFVAEVPLLFETGYDKEFDGTIAVVASLKHCQERFTASTGADANEYAKRMQRQWPIEKKAMHADFVIINDGDLNKLERDVETLFHQLTSKNFILETHED